MQRVKETKEDRSIRMASRRSNQLARKPNVYTIHTRPKRRLKRGVADPAVQRAALVKQARKAAKRLADAAAGGFN